MLVYKRWQHEQRTCLAWLVVHTVHMEGSLLVVQVETLCTGGDACAGSPKVLELFRSNRVLKAGRLHWAIPDCAPHSARRVFSDSPLTVPMVRGEKCVLSPGLGSDSTLTSHTQHWMYCVHD